MGTTSHILDLLTCLLILAGTQARIIRPKTQPVPVKPSSFSWPGGIVPYKFSPDLEFEAYHYEKIMYLIEDNSCVRFLPWNKATGRRLGHQVYLNFVKGDSCSANPLGDISKAGARDIACCRDLKCLHQLGNALGLYREKEDMYGYHTYKVHHTTTVITTTVRRVLTRKVQPVRAKRGAYSSGSGNEGQVLPEGPEELRGLDEYYYLFKDIAEAYHCGESKVCKGFKLACVNDGYKTVVHGKCACQCPDGLDPATGCSTPLKTVTCSWPTGQYALPLHEPERGCPGASLQSDHVNLHATNGQKLANPTICKTTSKNSNEPTSLEGKKFNWPIGQYCIYRWGGKCPSDFLPGSIRYYADEHSQHHVSSMEFCCQHKGFQNDKASFPTETPFALFASGTGGNQCQQVMGMKVSTEYLPLANDQGGRGIFKVEGMMTHWTYSKGKQIYLQLCHYTKADIDCGTAMTLGEKKKETTIGASAEGGAGKECTWIIKGEHENGILVLDFIKFDMKFGDNVEVRHADIGDKGLVYSGAKVGHSILTYSNVVEVRFIKYGDQKSSFKLKIKWIANDELCYDAKDRGLSYSGRVDYTRRFEACLPWSKVTKCPHHPSKTGGVHANLEGNYCRNPDNSFRPWCYTNADNCQRDYCDVCRLETLYDKEDNCKQLKKQGFCTKDTVAALRDCAKTCEDQVPDKEIIYEKECPAGYKEFNGACYLYINKEYTHRDAQAECNRQGAYLASPKSLAENEFVHSLRPKPVKRIWISAVDHVTEGKFIWGDGTKMAWSFWGPGEPNNQHEEDCVEMYKHKKWNDLPCDWKLEFVCQVPRSGATLGCKAPLVPSNVKILGEKKTSYKSGDVISFQCKSRDRPLPKGSTCLPSGAWTPVALRCPDCPLGYTEFKNGCYKFVSKKSTFDEAHAECEQEHAYLASPKNAAENDFVHSLRPEGHNLIWLGAMDTAKEGQFVWQDGTKVKWTNWDKHEPNNLGDEDCVEMRKSKKWNDITCHTDARSTGFVCYIPRLAAKAGCPPPTIPDNMELFSKAVSKYSFGHRVSFKCKGQDNKVPYDPICLPSGDWSPIPYTCPECPEGYSSFGDKCYAFVDKMVTYYQAQKECEKRNGHLVIPQSMEESDFIGSIKQGRSVWLGASDSIVEWNKWHSSCPKGYVVFKNACYGLVDRQCTYAEAIAACKQMKGYLASPTSFAENDVVDSLRKGHEVWLGATDSAKEGHWVRPNGKKLDWSNWQPGQPDNHYSHGEHCVHMLGDKKWNDIKCDLRYRLVCTVPMTDCVTMGAKNSWNSDKCNHRHGLIVAVPKIDTETRCGPPPIPSNGNPEAEVKSEYRVGEVVTYKCKHMGFVVDTTCLSSGHWSSSDFVCPGCPDGYTEFNHLCYILVDRLCTYNEAHAECRRRHGFIARPKSLEENTFVHGLGKNKHLWLGATDRKKEGHYVWEDGHNMEFNNWDRICKDGYTMFNDKCYKLVNQECTFAEAHAHCKKEGGYLASPQSLDENTFIDQIREGHHVWIGARDSAKEGTWVWENGKPVKYTNWHDGQPDKYVSEEDCAVMTNYNQWNDITCAARYRLVCTVPARVQPDNYANLEHCASMNPDTKWNDIRCDAKYSPVCAVPSLDCPLGFTAFDNSCYGYVNKKVTQPEAHAECEKLGGHLASPKSASENDFVHSFRPKSLPRIWLSAADTHQEGHFVWKDGSKMVWSNWSPGEPNNAINEDCVEMYSNKKWNDIPCNWKFEFVCQIPKLGCPMGYSEFQGSCYGFPDKKATYVEARATCEQLNGHLASSRSVEENEFIASLRPKPLRNIWLGGADGAKEGQFTWKDGSKMEWTNWVPGEPNNAGNEDCLEMRPNKKWNDVPCHWKSLVFNFVCNIPKLVRKVECQPPTVPSHGQIVGATKSTYGLGDIVSIQCRNKAHKSVAESMCLPSGQWSAYTLDCPDCLFGYSEFNGLCYGFVEKAMTYRHAQRECKKLGGYVAFAKSQADADFIHSLRGDQTVWLGATDRNSEREFRWADGSKMTWNNWIPGHEKRLGGEDCATMQPDKRWNDVDHCRQKFASVCAVPKLVCPMGYSEFQGSCYGFPDKKATYDEARATCEKLNGHLASSRSVEENEFIASLRPKPLAKIFLDGADRLKEGQFTWKDGSKMEWTNWLTGEPNNAGNEDCLEMRPNKKWNDVPCHRKDLIFNFVCNIPKLERFVDLTKLLTADDTP